METPRRATASRRAGTPTYLHYFYFSGAQVILIHPHYVDNTTLNKSYQCQNNDSVAGLAKHVLSLIVHKASAAQSVSLEVLWRPQSEKAGRCSNQLLADRQPYKLLLLSRYGYEAHVYKVELVIAVP